MARTPTHHLHAREAELTADIERLRAELVDLADTAGDADLSPGQQNRWNDLERAIDKKQLAANEIRDRIRATLVDDARHGRVVTVRPDDGPPEESGSWRHAQRGEGSTPRPSIAW